MPGIELIARFEIDHELERPLIVASLLRNLAGKLGQCLWTRQVDREEPVPTHGAANGPSVGPAAGDPDGDPRRLHRARLELARPELAEASEPVIESPRPLAGIDDLAERFELAVSVAPEPDAEDQSALAQVVEGDCLARDLVHAAPGERRNERAEADTLGVSGDRAQRHPRICDGADRRPVAEVVPQEHAVPALLLGVHRQSDERARIGQLVERRQVEPPPEVGRHLPPRYRRTASPRRLGSHYANAMDPATR